MALPLIPLAAGALGGIASALFGGSKKESNMTPSQDVYTTTNQNQYSYNITTDNSYNLIYDSPFASLKKGSMGSQTPNQTATQQVEAEQTPTQTQRDQQDMTGLLMLGCLVIGGLIAYREFTK